MSRPKDKKIDVARSAPPLQSNPFALLDGLDALKNLPPAAPAKSSPPSSKPKAEATILKKSRGRLILRREKKDRGGKVVVVIDGFAGMPGFSAVMIADLARELKGKLGCGGSFDRQEIVLQGDRCADVCALLEEIGFRVDGVRA
jgi:translation initiation factor 1